MTDSSLPFEISAQLAASAELRNPDDLSIGGVRRLAQTALTFESTTEMAEVVDRVIPGPAGPLPVRLYRPVAAEGLPVVVFFHGGGFVMGDIASHDALCQDLAAGSGCAFLSVEYRLAPEARYPAPVYDCYAAATWISVNGAELGVDGTRLAVAGNSSGGCMAAAVGLVARDRGTPPIRFQLLMYPVLDARRSMASYSENADQGLSPAQMAWFWNHYLPGDHGRGDEPYASPMRATEFGGLPPALVITADLDVLRDEGAAFAHELAAAGVNSVESRYADVGHGFVRRPGHQAERAKAEAAAALKDALR
jgi:acetyl esterase